MLSKKSFRIEVIMKRSLWAGLLFSIVLCSPAAYGQDTLNLRRCLLEMEISETCREILDDYPTIRDSIFGSENEDRENIFEEYNNESWFETLLEIWTPTPIEILQENLKNWGG